MSILNLFVNVVATLQWHPECHPPLPRTLCCPRPCLAWRVLASDSECSEWRGTGARWRGARPGRAWGMGSDGDGSQDGARSASCPALLGCLRDCHSRSRSSGTGGSTWC